MENTIHPTIASLPSRTFKIIKEKHKVFIRHKVVKFIALLSEECREIEENNRTGKTSNLFKKIRHTKGIFHIIGIYFIFQR